MIETIEAAINDARDVLKVLEAQMRAAGYEKASASINLRSSGGIVILLYCNGTDRPREGHPGFVTEYGRRYDFDFVEGATFTEALGRAHDAIRSMETHPSAAMAETWFNVNHPMNRPEGGPPRAASGSEVGIVAPQASPASPSSSAAAMSAEAGGDGAAAVLTSGAVAADAYSEEGE